MTTPALNTSAEAPKTVIVTGGARGIGYAFCEHLAGLGHRIVIADREGAEAAAARLVEQGLRAFGVRVDVVSETDAAAMVHAAEQAFGGVDALVNNAGLFTTLALQPFEKIDNAEWMKVMEVNTLGVFNCAKAASAALRRSGRGRLVNIASIVPMKGPPNMAHYVASKGAVIALTRSLAREMSRDKVTVNAIAPGFTLSDGVMATGLHERIGDNARTLGRCLQRDQMPADLVGALAFLISDGASFVTGQTLAVDGGGVFFDAAGRPMSAGLSVRVTRKTKEAEGICSFELVATDGRPLPAFSAGSHIDVHVPNGPGGLVRQYSLCNDPSETHRYLIAVLDDPASRGGSRAMHERVHEGDTLTIGAPRNQFRLVPQARRHLLLAGGIGVTPLLCMAESLATEGAEFDLHYATRTKARTAFLGRIHHSRYAARAQLHVDDGPLAQRLDLPAVLAPAAGTHLYVCGPQGFIDAVLAQARVQGWPEEQLHVEYFGTAPVATEGDATFEVELARSGRVITVPATCSVAEALLDAGVEIALSCEQGICGTCLTRVLGGIPDHRDSYLTPQEQAANDQFTPCCSRARSSRLVLDL